MAVVQNGFGGKMSKNRNRAKLNKAITGREYKLLWYDNLYPIYWDEGRWYRKGLLPYQYRMYRTWKYNRKKQWK